ICVTQPVSTFTNADELRQLVVSQSGQWQLSQDVTNETGDIVFHAYTTLDTTNLQQITDLVHGPIYAYNNTEKDKKHIVASWHARNHRYEEFTPGRDQAWLKAVESPAVTDQLQAMISQVQNALPGIFALTNKVAVVLDNAANATSNLNITLVETHPLLTNFTAISSQLREPGGLAVLALGTNGSGQIQGVLTNASSLLAHTDTNLTAMLFNLAGITSNLNTQVQSDTNMLGGISKMVTDSDDFIQGLKRHWLLRSAFKVKPTNAPPVKK
ncbi:MAG TPA: hypothetical protein VFC85_07645, partial [Verrucomicrobiae bacterium]|nr:hypothetical protein [Verrucomicrobiae bacterium]